MVSVIKTDQPVAQQWNQGIGLQQMGIVQCLDRGQGQQDHRATAPGQVQSSKPGAVVSLLLRCRGIWNITANHGRDYAVQKSEAFRGWRILLASEWGAYQNTSYVAQPCVLEGKIFHELKIFDVGFNE